MANAVIFQDSCDLYSQTSDLTGLGAYSAANSVTWGSTYGRFGAGGFQLTSGNSLLTRSIPGAAIAVMLSFALNMTNQNTTVAVVSLISSLGVECSLAFNQSTQQFVFHAGSTGGTIQWTNPALPSLTGGWHRVQLYVSLGTLASNDGFAAMYIDGVSYGSTISTAINTNQAGGSDFAAVSIGNSVSSNSFEGFMDDIIIQDVSGVSTGSLPWLPDCRIAPLSPVNDAGPNNGTPSSGSNHYAMVDSIPFNTSNYITMTNTSGQEELYGIGSLGVTPSEIIAVSLVIIAQKTDAGSANLEDIISSSGTVAVGSNGALSTSWGMYRSVFMTDPNTGVAWTASGVNALEIGYQVP